jgi:pimeloyl-ACP methyl ester carboxylesterase
VALLDALEPERVKLIGHDWGGFAGFLPDGTHPARLRGARPLCLDRAHTRLGDHADDMAVEYVPDSGHFIAEERPELVAERALELFGSVASTR